MNKFSLCKIFITIVILLVSINTYASPNMLDAFAITTDGDVQRYSIKLEILALMTALTLLPAVVLMMTSFTRIVIVLSILRQALGMPQTPSNQIIIGISLFLSLFVMSPIINDIYDKSLSPYIENKINQEDAISGATVYLKEFMYQQTRENDLNLFAELSGNTSLENEDINTIPMSIIIPAFVTSELKTAFQIGFIIFIPFLIIDLVVASVLMSMGMMMLSPLIISLPFKIMLFVLVDGWNLLLGTLASSFGVGA